MRFIIVILLLLGLVAEAQPLTFPLPKQVQDDAWSFVVQADLHAGVALSTYYTNSIQTMISNKANWKLKLYLSPGDTFEQSHTIANGAWTNDIGRCNGQLMTNQMWQLKANGIYPLPGQGNHDSDNTNLSDGVNITYWNDVFGTNFVDNGNPYFYTNRFENDTRQSAFKVTVGTSKFLFIFLPWIDSTNLSYAGYPSFATTNEMLAAYAPTLTWASNLCVANPDCYIIPVMHYFLDIAGNPNTKDYPEDSDDPLGSPHHSYVNEGPGVAAWDTFKGFSKLLSFYCGHVRFNPYVQNTLTATDGHPVNAVKFNSQSFVNTGQSLGLFSGGTFCLYTVYPALKLVRCRIWSSELNRFITDNDFPLMNFRSDYSFPMP